MIKRLGCLTSSGLLGLILTLAVVSGMVAARGYELFSPGELSAKSGEPLGGVSSHAEIGGECSLCHAAPWETAGMSERCTRCHVSVGLQMQDESTLHGVLFKNNDLLACQTCHPEHEGFDAPTTRLTGISFPHESFGFSLRAHQSGINHTPLECKACHGENLQVVNSIQCGACHMVLDKGFTEKHLVDFGSDCLACHDGLETYGKNFDHTLVPFRLEGAHVVTECITCHLGQTNLEDMRSTPQTCAECHLEDDAHEGKFGVDCGECHRSESWRTDAIDHALTGYPLIGKHLTVECEECHVNREFTNTSTQCIDCHREDDKHAGNLGVECGTCHNPEDWKQVTFDHNLTAFPLSGLHVNVVCKSCHVNNQYRGTPTQCFDCHAKNDKHQGQFGTQCQTCHTTAGWLPATFNHSLSVFKLTGQHVYAACTGCHKNEVYKGTPQTCYACHVSKDKHGGSFGTSCGSCHTTSGWLPAYFDHSKSRFPLTGAHSGASCNACHSNGVYRGTPTACISCHNQPSSHVGMSDTNCGNCHSTSNWNFSHPRYGEINPTSHEGARCADCHPSGYSSFTCLKCHDSNNPDD